MGEIPSRALSQALAKLLKRESSENSSKDIPLHAICYISDMDLKINNKLKTMLFKQLDQNMQSYSLKDLSYLCVALSAMDHPTTDQDANGTSTNLLDTVKQRITQLIGYNQTIDEQSMERLCLCDIDSDLIKIGNKSGVEQMEGIAENSNIIELLLTDLLQDKKVA